MPPGFGVSAAIFTCQYPGMRRASAWYGAAGAACVVGVAAAFAVTRVEATLPQWLVNQDVKSRMHEACLGQAYDWSADRESYSCFQTFDDGTTGMIRYTRKDCMLRISYGDLLMSESPHAACVKAKQGRPGR